MNNGQVIDRPISALETLGHKGRSVTKANSCITAEDKKIITTPQKESFPTSPHSGLEAMKHSTF